ncbi:MAG: hypothetical protein Q3999_00010 [Buchananella hordeovulneris]|nr:hypothetical protein [Buchananella hordeovulneris]
MHRQLSADERAVIEALILRAPVMADVPTSQREQWAATLDDLSVCGECGCGTCPSVELAYRGKPVTLAQSEEPEDRVILDAYTKDAVVMLFVDGGIPSYLEVAPYQDPDTRLPIPRVADLDLPR